MKRQWKTRILLFSLAMSTICVSTVGAAPKLMVANWWQQQDSEVPSAPLKRLNTLIDAINGMDQEEENEFFDQAFAGDEENASERKAKLLDARQMLGKVESKKIVESSEQHVTAVCHTSEGFDVRLTIVVQPESPYKITRIQLKIEPPDDSAALSPLDGQLREVIVKKLCEQLKSKYVFPQVAEEMATALESSLSSGEFDKIDDAKQFADQLTEHLREICHDKHLRIRAEQPKALGQQPGRRMADNHGFVKVEVLPGGIGYLKFNFFSGEKSAQETAAAAMGFLSNCKAVIFDLRNNGGGSPEMIAFLSGYLFEKSTHLNSFYNRITGETSESWSVKDVPGKRFPESTAVYVLTSNYTFSGAEEFSYNLKNLKRGTIVGEVTGGGAHPVMPVPLPNGMMVTMPFARAINPITKTNWEGTGVQPDVVVPADKALERAISLAQKALETDPPQPTATVKAPVPTLERASQLMAGQEFAEAAIAFRQIIASDADNAEAWFRLGYCLHMSGELDQAMEAHKHAATFDQFAGIANYNMACVHSLKGDLDSAITHLEKAVELGFRDARQIRNDSDMDNLRKDERFIKLMKELK